MKQELSKRELALEAVWQAAPARVAGDQLLARGLFHAASPEEKSFGFEMPAVKASWHWAEGGVGNLASGRRRWAHGLI